jgi:hypothetical protein
MTTAPPTSVATFGVSESAIQVHNGPSTTSSRKIIAISEDGMNRAAEVKKIAPSPIWPHPSRASHPTSAQVMRPNCANGAKTATASSCARAMAGAMDTPRYRRAMTMTSANARPVSSDRASPSTGPPPGAPTITTTPASATSIAHAVRTVSRSPSTTTPRPAATRGAMDCRIRTWATEA